MMRAQFRGEVIGRTSQGGGQLGQASLYQVRITDGRVLVFDYIDIASDGFRTVSVGEHVWCSADDADPQRARYVVPIRHFSPRALLGLPDATPSEVDAFTSLWL